MAQISFRGNIGKVRDIQFSNDGQARLGFSVAESHSRKNRQTNEWEDTGTSWFNVTVFGRQAEALAEVLREGAKQRVVVSGRQSTREYETNGETRSSLDVVADSVGLVPANPQGAAGGGSGVFSTQGGGNTRNASSGAFQGQWGQQSDWGRDDPPVF